jgi:hypothetical protein
LREQVVERGSQGHGVNHEIDIIDKLEVSEHAVTKEPVPAAMKKSVPSLPPGESSHTEPSGVVEGHQNSSVDSPSLTCAATVTS